MKHKGYIAITFFVLAMIWELAFNRGPDAHMFSDAFIILTFLTLSTLTNMMFSKICKKNVLLVPDLAMNFAFGFVLLMAFTNSLEIGENEISVAGLVLTVRTVATLAVWLFVFLMVFVHSLLLRNGSKIKCFLLSLFHLIMTCICMVIPLIIRIAYEIATE